MKALLRYASGMSYDVTDLAPEFVKRGFQKLWSMTDGRLIRVTIPHEQDERAYLTLEFQSVDELELLAHEMLAAAAEERMNQRGVKRSREKKKSAA